MPPSKKLFDTYYQVRGLEELSRMLDAIVVRGEDPRKGERLAAAREFGALDSHAAENVLRNLNQQIGHVEVENMER